MVGNKMSAKRTISASLLGCAGVFILVLSGCVSSAKYEALQAQHQQTTKEKASLEGKIKLLQNKLDDMQSKAKQLDAELEQTSATLESKKKALQSTQNKLTATSTELDATSQRLETAKSSLTQASDVLAKKDQALKKKDQELQKASAYMKRTNALYDQLVGELKNEVAANQVKVKEMKDGINVNLSEDILFPSGSAELNKSGKAVITRVSKKLTGKKYQIIVAGFTDNVPIRGSLAKRYPTNWELAGARAASVVRLLSSTGIDSNKLIASSYGENFPVASNDSDKGRAQNRRIEIRLRPLQ
jgi:chemotaxis protein MotB